jgi:peptidoglycan/LPS O-acetylase OafA/YrhL
MPLTTVTKLPERNLDVLRAVAVLCVVADHMLETLPSPRLVLGLTHAQIGRIGVLLFFVHTSLVLMASLERGGQGHRWIGRFYTRRAFRIYPLAIFAVIVTVLLHIPSGRALGVIAATPRTVLANLLLVQNLADAPSITGNLWTLPIEVQMYVLLPALYLLARRSVTLVLAALALSVLVFFVVEYAPVPGLWRITTVQFAPCFIGGGVLAFALLRKPRRWSMPPWTLPLVLLASVPIFLIFQPVWAHPEYGWPFAIFIGLVIPFVREIPESALHRAAKTIAKYSYGIYLTHNAALWCAFTVAAAVSPALQWAIFLFLFFTVPWLVYTFVEAPGIALGQRVLHGPITRAATAPAP